MRISDWSSDVCSSDLNDREGADRLENLQELVNAAAAFVAEENFEGLPAGRIPDAALAGQALSAEDDAVTPMSPLAAFLTHASLRSEEHTSELQSLMRISYAVFCLKKKTKKIAIIYNVLRKERTK